MKEATSLSAPQKDPSAMSLTEKVQTICDYLQGYGDPKGRQIAELFLELPPKELYPDYYQIILQPISIKEIRTNTYSTLDDFRKDFQLLVKNAQTYNAPKSQVYRDAQTLEKLFNTQLAKYFPDSVTTPTPKKRGRHPSTPSTSSTPATPSQGINGLSPVATPLLAATKEEQMDIDIEDDDDSDPARRKGRAAKIKAKQINYYDDEDDEDEDDEPKAKPIKKEIVEGEEPENAIEKLMGDRIKEGSSPPTYEFYVKWKGKSYLHARWVDEATLSETTLGRNRVKRYLQKKQERAQQANFLGETEPTDEYFNPEYLEVDRVIATKETDVNGQRKRLYLIKWQGLPYTEATWEKPEDFKDDLAIQQFFKFNQRPLVENKLTAADIRQTRKWQKLDKSPAFKGGNQLRPYQLEGLNWLVFCWYEGRGSILADGELFKQIWLMFSRNGAG
jgi:chromodomain-helicase-DNA-binding protein 7